MRTEPCLPRSLMAAIALVAAAGTASCGGTKAHLAGTLPERLAKAPVIIVKIVGGGVTDWQIERDESIFPRLAGCLPAALEPLCPQSCEVRDARDGEVLDPHLVLEVATSYSASAHFAMGFVLGVKYRLGDRASTEELGVFDYLYEPLSKVMAVEGSDMDEVLTHDSALTADRLCKDMALQAVELAKKAGN